jgi:hypothetical protein
MRANAMLSGPQVARHWQQLSCAINAGQPVSLCCVASRNLHLFAKRSLQFPREWTQRGPGRWLFLSCQTAARRRTGTMRSGVPM